jgi:hypothetical protein
MAAQTVKTDIAAEVNISARRNDSFKFELQVLAPGSTTASLDMVTGMTGDTDANVYQGKMSIVDASTGDVKLNIYSARWTSTDTEASADGTSVVPTATTPGHFYGVSSGSTNVGGGVDVSGMDGGELADRLIISAPHNYISFEPGVYKYDLQIRTRVSTGTTTEFTTWLFGTFTLNADITQL